MINSAPLIGKDPEYSGRVEILDFAALHQGYAVCLDCAYMTFSNFSKTTTATTLLLVGPLGLEPRTNGL